MEFEKSWSVAWPQSSISCGLTTGEGTMSALLDFVDKDLDPFTSTVLTLGISGLSHLGTLQPGLGWRNHQKREGP